ncbi:uncharacterized protein LACBIDRAFT_334332 [Laccaria bicolor S238N-H82]|uniref:Predicted protein n=1 Tax=Laccaria bicolor (strain S238N-H82 / ATCC MYA-4686) TaxID=486041 RepID=B0DYW1_LACBS|nr:uncharacterized protein LACBIDRAFT_334332 [Laccaria bicolor S238N-H82]EDR00212.1 predicted protein [Laccaria bicolor S238N-H82]|eukprot:XP_001889121.1 predicted protein [Laccaria bicolor S238N-H82]
MCSIFGELAGDQLARASVELPASRLCFTVLIRFNSSCSIAAAQAGMESGLQTEDAEFQLHFCDCQPKSHVPFSHSHLLRRWTLLVAPLHRMLDGEKITTRNTTRWDEEVDVEEVLFGRCAPRWGDVALWAEGAYILVAGEWKCWFRGERPREKDTKRIRRLPLPKRTTNKPNNIIHPSPFQNHPPHAQTRTKLIQTLRQRRTIPTSHSSSGTLGQYARPFPRIRYEVFEMTQPGLSTFAGNPEGAARSLDIPPDFVFAILGVLLEKNVDSRIHLHAFEVNMQVDHYRLPRSTLHDLEQ